MLCVNILQIYVLIKLICLLFCFFRFYKGVITGFDRELKKHKVHYYGCMPLLTSFIILFCWE